MYNFSALSEGASYIVTACSETDKNSASAASPRREKTTNKNKKKPVPKFLFGNKSAPINECFLLQAHWDRRHLLIQPVVSSDDKWLQN